MQTYRVAVVGCGNIGSLWDERNPDPSFPKTHIGAIKKNKNRLQLIGACDLSEERIRAAEKYWQIPFVTSCLAELLEHKPDLLGIATPLAEGRIRFLDQIIKAGIRGILCEKPVAYNLKEACAIKELISGCKASLVVNYTRRFDANFQLIRQMIVNQQFGATTKVICSYGKGLKNNGSHMIDLLLWFFGLPIEVMYLGTVSDVLPADPTIDAALIYEGYRVHLAAQSSHHYTNFELDIFFAKGRVRILNGGRDIEIYEVVPDSDFPDYRILKCNNHLGGGLRRTLPAAYQHVVELLDGSVEHISTIDDSINVLKVISAIETAMSKRDKLCKLES